MSAAEIIALIEKLPPTERAEVIAFLDKKESAGSVEGVRRMELAKGVAAGEAVFDRHSDLFRRLAQ